LMVS